MANRYNIPSLYLDKLPMQFHLKKIDSPSTIIKKLIRHRFRLRAILNEIPFQFIFPRFCIPALRCCTFCDNHSLEAAIDKIRPIPHADEIIYFR